MSALVAFLLVFVAVSVSVLPFRHPQTHVPVRSDWSEYLLVSVLVLRLEVGASSLQVQWEEGEEGEEGEVQPEMVHQLFP